jgi:hypothetical protein
MSIAVSIVSVIFTTSFCAVLRAAFILFSSQSSGWRGICAELLKLYHIITETSKFNKENHRAIIYKLTPLTPLLKVAVGAVVFVNKITKTPINGIKIK